MAVKVLDASAAAAMLFAEPAGERLFAELGDCELVAPSLLHFELANVCVVKCRKHPERRGALMDAFGSRDQLAVTEAPVNYDAVLALARELDLSAYDASYLWLARALGVPLVTLDRRLAKAAAADR